MKKSLCLFVLMAACTGLSTQFAVAQNKPNILFCIADDASMSSFGAYGDTFVNTPAIDRMADKGAVFTNAFNCNPKCAPARACLVTGKFSWQLKAACDHFSHFPAEFRSYPQLLMQHGYHVGYTGKGWAPGVYDTKYNPAGPAYNDIKLKPPYSGISTVDYAANFKAFLDKRETGQPFCFWLGTHEPHRKYELDAWKKAGRDIAAVPVQPFLPDNPTVRGDLLDYALEVEWYDNQVGQAIQLLEDRGLLDNTLVIITSDHGMPFPRVKGQIYEEGFHVPFIAYWKGVVQAGRVIDDFINFPDVAPTLMEVAGLKPDTQMTGKSFLQVLQSPKSGQIDASRNYVLLGKERHDVGRSSDEGTNLSYPVRAIRNNKYLYIRNYKPDRWPVGNPEFGFLNCDDGPTKSYLTALQPNSRDYPYFVLCFDRRPAEELYDIVSDPACMKNLAVMPSFQKLKLQMRQQMEEELKIQGDPRMTSHSDVFDHYQFYGKGLDYKTGERLPPPVWKGKDVYKKQF